MPLPEVYMAIQQGAVWGQENPIDRSIATNYRGRAVCDAHEARLQPHPPRHFVLAKTWQTLSQADREAVTKAAKEAADWSRKTIQANDDNQLKEMASKGAKVNNPSADPFRRAVQPVYGKARHKYGAANVDAFLADAAAVRKGSPRQSHPRPALKLKPGGRPYCKGGPQKGTLFQYESLPFTAGPAGAKVDPVAW